MLFLLLIVSTSCGAVAGVPATSDVEGPYQPTSESFRQYQCPDWFRDAKFGIWAHWGPASVPGIGNGYPTDMYHQGTASYEYQLKHYGHPSEVGFKDVIASWKAEKFDPDALMKRYKAAGAKYFVALATHHDNFDCFASGFAWNSVNIGPKKDIVGMWRKAALENGLHFGVSSHADRAWKYYQGSYGADAKGAKAGVPYDGANPANGSLYQKPHGPSDKESEEFIQLWFERHKELIDQYQPDLLYFDGGIPFSNTVGNQLVARYLNANIKQNGGKLEAVLNVKANQFVNDYERGQAITIQDEPWQCDTSLGGWFFLNDSIADYQSKSKDATTVIHNLADIVSKNGNLLLNLPQRGDGTLYPECEKVLDELARWMPINGEAIFGTRPWLAFGEGPSALPAAKYMNELKHPLTWQDVRFTTKGATLYAICLGVPEREVRIAALGRLGKKIASVQLLGSQDKLSWKQDWEGLTIQPASHWPCDHAVTFKVEFAR